MDTVWDKLRDVQSRRSKIENKGLYIEENRMCDEEIGISYPIIKDMVSRGYRKEEIIEMFMKNGVKWDGYSNGIMLKSVGIFQ